MTGLLECKMCGGNIIAAENDIMGKCEYCQSISVIPKQTTNNNKINRANYLRRCNEFDKAAMLFEEIVEENSDDSEAYWGLLLCKFGIEYVDDSDGSKKPTCHRTMFNSILDDPDYKMAISTALDSARYIYEDEAHKIDEIQKKIKSIAANEKPYDIFICYKESDNIGQRTRDSLEVQEIYNKLIKKGYKVFYARKTLQEKLGLEYEPVIFAALISSKVMLVYGSQAEFFNSVWVKNEWSRFRQMMKSNPDKRLIPIYDSSSMTAYDLPNELADFQAFDKHRIGFIEDLIEGLEKIMDRSKKENIIADTSSDIIQSDLSGLIKRTFLFIEDEDWESAEAYCEKILDKDPEEAIVYFLKVMIEFKIKKLEDFDNAKIDISNSSNYEKAIRFADEAQEKQFIEYKNVCLYNIASELYLTSYNNSMYILAAEKFKTLGDFRDSNQKYLECIKKANEPLYETALELFKSADSEGGFYQVAQMFKNLGNYRDSKEKALECKEKANELLYTKALNSLDKASTKNELLLSSYLFAKLKNFGDSQKKLLECNEKLNNLQYQDALQAKNSAITEQDYIEAIAKFELLNNFSDSHQQIIECNQMIENLKARKVESEKSKLKIGISLLIFIVLFSILLPQIAKPLIILNNYNNAVNDYALGKYMSSMSLFMNTYPFKDSDKYLVELAKIINRKSYSISAGGYHTVGIESSNMVVAVGHNEFGQCNVSGWQSIIAVSAGKYHTVGLNDDGSVVAVGNNVYGQCNVSDWSDIIAISAGGYHTVGLKRDGSVVAVGDNTSGQCTVSNWKNISFISAGDYHTVGLKDDGTVVAAKNNRGDQCRLSDWKDISCISVGGAFTLGLKKDRTLIVKGSHTFPESTFDSYPRKNTIIISAGDDYLIELLDNGEIEVNGDYNIVNKLYPYNKHYENIIAISAGKNHFVALKDDGTVYSSGNNDYGQCDVESWVIKGRVE